MNILRLKSNVGRFLPFLLILILVLILAQWQKRGPLPGPHVKLLGPGMRSDRGTEFTLPDLSGKMINLSDFKGNVVVMNFFATWCGPCRQEMPSLEQVFQAYKHKDFVVLGVAGDVQGQEVVAPFVKEYGMTFPVVLDPQNVVSKQYRVRGIPTVYLVDRQGQIAGTYVGGADWNSEEARSVIDQLLRE